MSTKDMPYWMKFYLVWAEANPDLIAERKMLVARQAFEEAFKIAELIYKPLDKL